MIRPKRDDFLKMARPEHIVPVVKELPSDTITAVDAFYATGASYLLESAEKGMHIGRFSFLGVDPELRIEIRGEECRILERDTEKKVTLHDPLRYVGRLLKQRPYMGRGDLTPFPGGAVGYIGYESVRRWEDIGEKKGKASLGLPDAVFLFTRFTLAFDNLMHTLKIICNVKVGENPESDYEQAVQDIEKITQQLMNRPEATPDVSEAMPITALKSSYPKQRFLDDVQKIKDLIYQGEAIQVVLSQRFSVEYEDDPFLIYRKLRTINPSPYMFYLDFNDFVIFGASPELMVKVEDDKAVIRPIAGTRPRGKNMEEDIRLKADLLADEKEQAEHLMLVDLARNDLGRIAQPGSVSVDRLMDVEMYSHVMHIVSEVSAKLRARTDMFDVIKASFPAGTVSGAPKVRAMEIIEDLEPLVRGPYAGMIGYLSYTGGFDSCITIRSVVADGKKLYMQAGAGIVYDSNPEDEYQETLNKAGAFFQALKSGRKK